MKTSLRLTIAALGLAIFFTMSVQAQFDYVITNGTITITGYTGPGGDVIIPSEIDGLPVTSIKGGAFRGCTSLTSATIPDSVTNIEDDPPRACY